MIEKLQALFAIPTVRWSVRVGLIILGISLLLILPDAIWWKSGYAEWWTGNVLEPLLHKLGL